jgi:hypothetical protein
LLLGEGLVVAALGGLLGVAGGVLYARGILWGLTTLWSAAVANSALRFYVTPGTLAGGGAASVVIGVAVMWFAARSQTRRTARDLLEQGNEMEARSSLARGGRRWAGWVAAASFLGALALAGGAMGQRNHAAVAAFFGGGTLLLIAGIAVAALWFRSLADARPSKPLSLFTLAVRGCARQPKRSLATVALLASRLIPAKAEADAAHIATAAVHGMDFLLTWNCRHIANAAIVEQLRAICEREGFPAPVICTPHELMV